MTRLSLGASVYYSKAIVWPQETVNVYAERRVMWGGLMTCIVGAGITFGEILGVSRSLEVPVHDGQLLWVHFSSAWPLSAGPPRRIWPLPLWYSLQSLSAGMKPLYFPSAQTSFLKAEIGTAAGLAGSSRSAISTVASTMYSVVLASKITKELIQKIPAAVVSAGLPADSVPAYMPP
ncbi:Nn.00g021010.m01.CDS01 [Neocucurbitaria sp. VM-36]